MGHDAIIGGLRYSTATASLLGEAQHGKAEDATHWKQALYKTPNGRYFLTIAGGPSTIYCGYAEDGTCTDGFEIRPVTAKRALNWCVANGLRDVAEAQFGSIIKDA